MSFSLLTIREADGEADALYPTPADQPDTVEPRGDDGQISAALPVSDLKVLELVPAAKPKELVRLKDVTGALRTTDCRITLACSKYETGGGFMPFGLGAVPAALAANAVSRARVAKRRAGKMLVGHVPYAWLASVGFKPRATPVGHDRLRLGTLDPTAREFRGLLLEATVPRSLSGAEIARSIAAHAATCRLATGDAIDGSISEHLNNVARASQLAPLPNGFASYFLVEFADEARALGYQMA